MNYWLARKVSEGFRSINSYGPSWIYLDYYDVDISASEHGALAPEKLDLRWNASEWRLPKADFVDNSLMECRRDLYDPHFSSLLKGLVKTWDFKIEEVSYISFRPTTFLPLEIDYENSKYLEREGRGPYAFRKIALAETPPDDIPIFALEKPNSCYFQQIVSQDFVDIYERESMTGLKFVPAWTG